MKNLQLFAAISAASLLAACGGGSLTSGSKSSTTTTNTGTGNNGTTGTPIAPSGTHIEAIVSNLTTFDNGSKSFGVKFQYQDLGTIQSMDQVQFQLVYYSSTGTRVVLPADQWSSSDTASLYGTLAGNSGTFVASSATTPTPQIISVSYNDQTYNAAYNVLPRQVRLRGLLDSDTTHAGIAGVEVDFYGFSNISNDTPYAVQSVLDTAGKSHTEYVFPTTYNNSTLVFLGRTTTQADGTFRASVPSGTYGFTLVNSTIPSGYQRFYRFKGNLYNTGDTYPLGLAPIPTPAPITTPPSSALPNPLPSPITSAIAKELPILNNYLLNGEYFLANYSTNNPATNGTVDLIPNSETVSAPVN